MAGTSQLEDLARLQSMADELDRYLDAGRPFRPISVALPSGGRAPGTLSLGGFLQLLIELQAQRGALAVEQQRELDAAAEVFEDVRAGRARDYGSVLRRELKSRIDSWRWFVDDCRRGERDRVADYRFEADLRTKIALLTAEAGELEVDVDDERRSARVLDGDLMRLLRDAPYSGPEGLSDRFPKESYWWLYGRPTASV